MPKAPKRRPGPAAAPARPPDHARDGSAGNPYRVGQRLRGGWPDGRKFSGVVTGIPGPYSVEMDGKYFTPLGLIHGEDHGEEVEGQGKEAAQQTASTARVEGRPKKDRTGGGQGDLFG